MKSIQSRLGAGLLISLIAVFFLLWLLVSSNIQNLSENYIASRLHHDIETIVSAIDFDETNKLITNAERINPVYQRPFSGHYYTIQHNNELYRSRSLWDQSLNKYTPEKGEYMSSQQAGPENQTLIIVSTQLNKSDQNFTISVAEDLSPVIEDINKFKHYFAFLAAGLLLVLLILQIIILRKGLKPLANIQSELLELEQGKIKKLSDNAPKELKPLIFEINHLLTIMQQRLQRSRNAISDLSHAIKKPLTVIQQLNHDQKKPDAIDYTDNMNEQISNIQQLTDRILKRARLSAGSYSGAVFDFNADLSTLIKTIQSMYPDKNIKIKTDIKNDIHAYLDREDIMELLGNLLDNAYKWSKSLIRISVQQKDKLIIKIEDDGQGSKMDTLNQLVERGVRMDENVTGYGFGLAIASDIIKDYEGDLSFNRSSRLGGFKATITLPVKN